jgi:hypothetical protein
MNKVYETVIAEFASVDAQLIIDSLTWAKERAIAISEFKSNPSNDDSNVWNYYAKLFAIAGGKTWYKVLEYGFSSSAQAFVVKNCELISKKRNLSIAKKLEAAGVELIVSAEVTLNNGGFDGFYKVTTNMGLDKSIKISTIYAGGYSIQCAHVRCLVKVY